ncbi:acyltransferase, partial [Salmonella enterica]|nr:acyltransferase [Salmonella enterica]
MEHLKYRPDIDGLRAIAVLSVVIFHYFPSILPGGFVGVDIFFVISGYLITSIILKSASSNSFSYVEFYKRRILRIFPALSIVLISCIIIGWFYFFQDDYKSLGKHV